MKRLFQTFGLAALLALVWLTLRIQAQPVTVNGSGGGGGATNAVSSISGNSITTTYSTNAGAISATLKLSDLFTNTIVYVETNGNDSTAKFGQRSFPWKTADTAIPIAVASNSPVVFGYGTFAITNYITNSVYITGQGSGGTGTTFVCYNPITGAGGATGNDDPIFCWQDGTILRNFDVEPFPVTGFTNLQALLGFNNDIEAPVLTSFNNLIVENVSTTNAGADFIYIKGYTLSTNVYIHNVLARGVWDLWLDQTGLMGGTVDSCQFYAQGPNTIAGGTNTCHAINISAGSHATPLLWKNCTFSAINTNAAAFAENSQAQCTFTGCTFTGSNYTSGAFTNFASVASYLSGADYNYFFGCNIPITGIKLKASAAALFQISPMPLTNSSPVAGGIFQTDGTNSYCSQSINSPTNFGTVNLVSNFTQTYNAVFTNPYPFRVLVYSAYEGTYGGTAGGGSVTFTLNLTNNGVHVPYPPVFAVSGGIITNTIQGGMTFELGFGDGYSITTALSGTGSTANQVSLLSSMVTH